MQFSMRSAGMMGLLDMDTPLFWQIVSCCWEISALALKVFEITICDLKLSDFPKAAQLEITACDFKVTNRDLDPLPLALEVPFWNLKSPHASGYCSGVQISLRAMARAVSVSSSAITPQSSNSRI
jgi:hypothetical protein